MRAHTYSSYISVSTGFTFVITDSNIDKATMVKPFVRVIKLLTI